MSVEAVVWQIGFVDNIPSVKLQPTVESLRGQSFAWDILEKDELSYLLETLSISRNSALTIS